jgi:hypothetical protein
MRMVPREVAMQAEEAFQKWCSERLPSGPREQLRLAFVTGWVHHRELAAVLPSEPDYLDEDPE